MSAEPSQHQVLDELLARTVGPDADIAIPREAFSASRLRGAGAAASNAPAPSGPGEGGLGDGVPGSNLPTTPADPVGSGAGPQRSQRRSPRGDAGMGRGPLALHLSRAATEERLAESEQRLQEAREEINERDRRLAHATVSVTKAAEDVARVTEQVATVQQQLSDARTAAQDASSARFDAEQARAALQVELSGAQMRERELRVALEAERIARQRAEGIGAGLRSALDTLRPLVGVLGQATAELRGALELTPIGDDQDDAPGQQPSMPAADGPDRDAEAAGGAQQRPRSSARTGSEAAEIGLVRVLAEVVDRWRTHTNEQ